MKKVEINPATGMMLVTTRADANKVMLQHSRALTGIAEQLTSINRQLDQMIRDHEALGLTLAELDDVIEIRESYRRSRDLLLKPLEDMRNAD